ncbi:hypothetical protein GF373_05935, partial [bacterium]|nr:hypothetical protein [bacterium]
MIKTLGRIVLFLLSLPAILIQQVRRLFRWVASPRWYLLAFIPCNAGLWWLGLYLWEKPLESRVLRFFLRFLSLACLIFGTFVFFAGLWPLAALALPIRLIIWLDRWLHLDRAFYQPAMATKNQIMQNPYDRLALGFILLVLMVLVINQERLPLLLDISDQYYHMAVAQKIWERGHIPLWDDWEFAPMGRPHLYPPLLHLLIAFLAKTPGQIEQGYAAYQVFLYPALLFSYWYLFRFLFGPTLALLSLLFMSMEFMFMMGASLGLPASLVNLFWPWLLLAIIKKRTYLATILLGLSYYTHTGIPPLITLGLWIWGLWQREYLKQVVFITVGAMVLATPWLVRYWVFSDWIQSGGAQGYSLESRLSHILWLLILNPI